MNGRQASPDEEVFFRQAETWHRSHRLDLEPLSTIPPGHHLRQTPGGRHWPLYGPSLLPLHWPLVAAGTHLPGSWFTGLTSPRDHPFAEPPFTDPAPRWTFALGGVLALWLLLLFVRRATVVLGGDERDAAWAMLLITVATPIGAYSKTAFRDLPLAAWLLAALIETVVASRGRSWRRSCVAGMLFGLAYLAKDQVAVHVTLTAPFVAWCVGWRGALAFGLGFTAAALPLLVFKAVIFGSLLEATGGGIAAQLTTPWSLGLVGLLFAPGKGLVCFAPIVLFALPAAVERWRHGPRGETILITANLAAMLLIPARWWFWHGGLCWGPRLLLPLLPWLGILAALTRPRLIGRLQTVTFHGAVIIGLLVNLGGIALDWHWFHVVQEHRMINVENDTDEGFYRRLAFEPAESIILAGWRAAGLLRPAPVPSGFSGADNQALWHLLTRRDPILARIDIRSNRAYLFLLLGIWAMLCLAGWLISLRRRTRETAVEAPRSPPSIGRS